MNLDEDVHSSYDIYSFIRNSFAESPSYLICKVWNIEQHAAEHDRRSNGLSDVFGKQPGPGDRRQCRRTSVEKELMRAAAARPSDLFFVYSFSLLSGTTSADFKLMNLKLNLRLTSC